MKKVQFLPLMALVLGLGLTVTMSAFKSVNRLAQPENGWYLVGLDGNTITSTSPTPTAPPAIDPEGCARTGNFGKICAVYLEFTADVPIPATVTAASTASNVDLGPQAQEPLD